MFMNMLLQCIIYIPGIVKEKHPKYWRMPSFTARVTAVLRDASWISGGTKSRKPSSDSKKGKGKGKGKGKSSSSKPREESDEEVEEDSDMFCEESEESDSD